jgi:hypothetical protein
MKNIKKDDVECNKREKRVKGKIRNIKRAKEKIRNVKKEEEKDME